MIVQIQCPQCGKSHKVKPEMGGKAAACSACKSKFRLPDQATLHQMGTSESGIPAAPTTPPAQAPQSQAALPAAPAIPSSDPAWDSFPESDPFSEDFLTRDSNDPSISSPAVPSRPSKRRGTSNADSSAIINIVLQPILLCPVVGVIAMIVYLVVFRYWW